MVIEVCGGSPVLVRNAAVASTIRSSPRRSSGSPPVNRTSVTPRFSTAIRTSRFTSSSLSTSLPGSQSRPSAGMQ